MNRKMYRFIIIFLGVLIIVYGFEKYSTIKPINLVLTKVGVFEKEYPLESFTESDLFNSSRVLLNEREKIRSISSGAEFSVWLNSTYLNEWIYENKKRKEFNSFVEAGSTLYRIVIDEKKEQLNTKENSVLYETEYTVLLQNVDGSYKRDGRYKIKLVLANSAHDTLKIKSEEISKID